MSDLYERDFYGWSIEQADLIRSGKLCDADLQHIAEEIESMGRSERNQLTSRLEVLLAHLLKWHFQPGLRGNSWRLTIREQRKRATDLLDDNPSLEPALEHLIRRAYGGALIAAQRETGLPEQSFPATCPWTFEEAMTAALEE